MAVLVTGGSGVVGGNFIQAYRHNFDMAYTYYMSDIDYSGAAGFQLDIRSQEKVDRLMKDLDPNVVVHSAALTNVDECETNAKKAQEVNIKGTKNVVDSMTGDSHLIFLSTSFVFDGSKHPHEVDDPLNPVNEYGKSKAEAEKLIRESDVTSTIIRTDQPYGWTNSWQKPTMVEWVLNELKESNSLEVFDDWYNVPIYLDDLSTAIQRFSKEKRAGTYHVVGPNYISRYNWAIKIAQQFGYDSTVVEPISSSIANLPATRPNVYIKSTENQPTTVATGLKRMDSEKASN